MSGATPEISVLIPVCNEAESLPILYDEIRRALDGLGRPYEIVIVDDGSSDSSPDIERELARKDSRVTVLLFTRNFGQTAALAAAIDRARGSILIPIDADLQNDPADIPRMIAKLEEGYDVVSGWRRPRRDPWLTRVLPSQVANLLISCVTRVPLHDYGCSLKVYRRDVLAGVRLYGEMHRFTPVYAAWQGARVTEMQVHHRPRTRGRSKYGFLRTLKVPLDLFTVKLLGDYSTKPMYFFGGMGLVLLFGGLASAGWSVYKLIRWQHPVFTDPFALFAVFLFLTGLICIQMGLLAELIVRTYHESQNKPVYAVREVIHGDDADTGRRAGAG
ncbi:MAG: glycosyltransferase family 2 protein [Planctomycetota bacterium]